MSATPEGVQRLISSFKQAAAKSYEDYCNGATFADLETLRNKLSQLLKAHSYLNGATHSTAALAALKNDIDTFNGAVVQQRRALQSSCVELQVLDASPLLLI
jgi:hypothetical protein